MIYRITYTGGHKYASPVSNREELMKLRDSAENLDNLRKVRQGDGKAKANLLQLAYNLGHVNGALAGCKSIGSYFFHDIDCYDAAQTESYRDLILSPALPFWSVRSRWPLCSRSRWTPVSTTCSGLCFLPVAVPTIWCFSTMSCLASP